MPVINCIQSIKSKFTNAVIARCQEMGCELKLNGLSNYVILKGERICRGSRICDCIIFTGDNCIIIGIAELKSKTIHSSEIMEKLANGSKIALDILKECCNSSMKFDFYHLVLCKKWSTSEYRVITNTKITVGGKKYEIIPKRCGVSFFALISSFK